MTREDEIRMFNDIYIYTGNMEDSVDIEHIMYNMKLPRTENYNNTVEEWLNYHDIDDDVTIENDFLYKYSKVNKTLRRRVDLSKENEDFIPESVYMKAKLSLMKQVGKEDEVKSVDLIKKDFSNIHKIQTIIIVGSGDDIDKFIIDNNFMPMYDSCRSRHYHMIVISRLKFIVFNDFTILNVEDAMSDFRIFAQQFKNVIIISFLPIPFLRLSPTDLIIYEILHKILVPYYSSKVHYIFNLPSEPLRVILETESSKSRVDHNSSFEYIFSNPEEYLIKDMSRAFIGTRPCSIS